MGRLLDTLGRSGRFGLAEGADMPRSVAQDLWAALLQPDAVIVVDNVCEFLYTGTDQEHWDLHEDFPNLAPPFGRFWLETRAPQRVVSREYGVCEWPQDSPPAWGALFLVAERESAENIHGREWSERETLAVRYQRAAEAAMRSLPAEDQAALRAGWVLPEHPTRRQINIQRTRDIAALGRALATGDAEESLRLIRTRTETARWDMTVCLFEEQRDHSPPTLSAAWSMPIAADGRMATSHGHVLLSGGPMCPAGTDEAIRSALNNLTVALMYPLLLAICFVHCKNVTLQPVDVPEKQAKRLARKRGYVPVRYHVLNIEPMRGVLRREGRSAETGIRQAIHLCRGHFKDYRSGRGLFGRTHGLYWWDMQVRGDAAMGVVAKGYEVQAPGESVRSVER